MRRLHSCLIATVFCLLGIVSTVHHSLALSVAERDQVNVSGERLMRGGRRWTPHGFVQIAFAVPPKAFSSNPNDKFRRAYEDYSAHEYTDMRSAGADSVRMQLAQDGSNPDNAEYFDRAWRNKAIGAVRAARQAGLVVILSIQDEKQTGARKAALPNDGTKRVWRDLAPLFCDDPGVLFELYNEPNLHPNVRPAAQVPSKGDWDSWAKAMNEIVAEVRGLGANNVLVVDGLANAQALSGASDLKDPLRQVVYATHPYAGNQKQQTGGAWRKKFGFFSETHPVIVTEWGVGYFCDPDTPASSVRFLQYLQEHRIGLEAVTWDWAPYNFASAVQGFPKPHFSSFLTLARPDACSKAYPKPMQGTGPDTAYGPGKIIETWYLTGKPPLAPE